MGDIEALEFETSKGEVLTSPFEVVVLSRDSIFLGYGKIVGQISEGEDCVPIIEMEDPQAPDGLVHLLGGIECQWEVSTELLKAKLAEVAGGVFTALRPFEYTQALDRAYNAGNN